MLNNLQRYPGIEEQGFFFYFNLHYHHLAQRIELQLGLSGQISFVASKQSSMCTPFRIRRCSHLSLPVRLPNPDIRSTGADYK